MAGERCQCIFKECRINYQGEKTSHFYAKVDTFDRWRKIIPGLTRTSKVCARHFDESDLKKGAVIDGIFHPYKLWRLRKGAVPKYHLGRINLSV